MCRYIVIVIVIKSQRRKEHYGWFKWKKKVISVIKIISWKSREGRHMKKNLKIIKYLFSITALGIVSDILFKLFSCYE